MDDTAADRTPPARCVAPANARRLAAWAYAALLAGLLLYVAAIWLQVVIDTRKLAVPTPDLTAESHRLWRLRSTLLFLLWSVLGLITTPLVIGWFVVIAAYLWYAVRVIRGAIWFARGQPIGARYLRHAERMMRGVQS
ncbi:MAG: hypothetical protein IT503_00690 [Burkholderiaceae bacterium]|nr:MAG: hypothetical protein F9K36_14695 [Burkholderiaceae bacterium]MBE7426451.1 hypothetical protein [Ideonella sp.]MCC7284670.1 hypothetical protein [Burkholderiaceae bacterium]